MLLTPDQPADSAPRTGYVVKRYPRFSETFIVNEVLAHEAAGLDIEIFSLRAPSDTHFQNTISEVRAPVRYLTYGSFKASELWQLMQSASQDQPSIWETVQWASEHGVAVGELYQAMELALAARRTNLSHLHAHFATSAARVTRLAAHMSDIPFSVTMHAKDIFHESVDTAELRSLVEDAAFVVTVSEFNRRYLGEWLENSDKIHRIYNGLDLNQFSFHREGRQDRLLLGIGRLVPKKGFADLIDACALLKEQGVSFQCEIIGSGELAATLAEQIVERDVADRVTLLGPLPQSEVRRRLREATLLAAPCVVADDGNRDGLPTVITEAMALGTPVVGTNVTGIPEIVRHGETGLIVDQHDPAALAAACRQIIEQPELADRLARAARQHVQRHFDIRNNAAALRQLLVNHRAGRSRVRPCLVEN